MTKAIALVNIQEKGCTLSYIYPSLPFNVNFFKTTILNLTLKLNTTVGWDG